ncbi:leukocyte cell-derived chemotaxin-2-like isoform X1 [Xiphias gladius]|uniref:leukocyte cell-derived chemotaxin-2-like isoform X1 n=1 Tax=Xiphias gladius TaxID=8245 RepID=UPI001A97F973|nr:leukocyte cell-derived chemotaxin-2-like isoform X1 [Xiphias gladius]
MRMLLRVCLIATLLICCVLLNCASEHKKRKGEEFQSNEKNASSNIKLRRNYTTAHDGRSEAVSPKKKVKKTGNKRISMGPRSDISCTTLGGICQPNRYICQGRYLKDKCSGTKMRQCCMPVRAWSVLCAGHHNNRVRACDVHGCGAFNSKRGNGLHKAVDLVCDDYGIANAPFSGTLAGPVSRKDPAGNQYEGLRLLSDVHCVKIFNIRPFRYIGPVAQGEALGYLLPLQERFSGITSHLELQMCDGTDPSPFI